MPARQPGVFRRGSWREGNLGVGKPARWFSRPRDRRASVLDCASPLGGQRNAKGSARGDGVAMPRMVLLARLHFVASYKIPCSPRLSTRVSPSRAANQISRAPQRPPCAERKQVAGNFRRSFFAVRSATGSRPRSALVAASPLGVLGTSGACRWFPLLRPVAAESPPAQRVTGSSARGCTTLPAARAPTAFSAETSALI